ncbi:Homeobox-leucine zipper protein HDG11 [Senna tora]|uniref:Homeobox-leucine zipper protein HDG11 n=1 Tax=Senna tora TaxID=362788 RepID=A0A834T0B9_9FABA|nr:Homeobox-leucine zipper protein HDG11 [Senna tora]
MAVLMAGRSIGQYTTSEPEESMQVSCSISMLTDMEFPGCDPLAIWATSCTALPFERTSH